ncbi:MAG TPA: glycosyltransferase 87 family protein, partial [Thermoflexales bacterium]|nr:glycosyltransferase 87 family protein [Thermoflexales bacterium]
MTPQRRLVCGAAAFLAFGLGVLIRAQWLSFQSADMVSALRLWYDYLALSGSLDALRLRIGTYSPPYLYLLGLAVQVRELYFPALSQVIAIKAPSLVFDALGAWWMYVLVRRARGTEMALLAAGALWLAPTVWLNSAVWGQCDIVFSALALLSLVWLTGGRPRSAALSFGVALATKAQAIFLAPVTLYRWFGDRRRVSEALFIAAGFLLAMAPALAVGAPMRTTVLAYLGQADEFLGLNFLAPN